jgi:type VI secretion system protein
MLNTTHPRVLAGLFLCTLLGGCSSILKPVRKVSHLSGEVSVDVSVDPDANQNMPVAVDILTVDDARTLKEISAMSAQAWFQKRANYVRLHPSELHVYSWEWVPGQEVAPLRIPQAALASGIILFAAYASPGEHSSALPKSGVVRIQLGAKDFKILPGRA